MKRDENFISDLVGQAETQFRNQVRGRGQIENKMADQAHDRMEGHAWNQVMSQVLDRVESQVWDQVRIKVHNNL
jgi:hypothetical protein